MALPTREFKRHRQLLAPFGGRIIRSMLTDLFIRNIAIIDRLELEFGPGMTVLTGETGAGKSILLDAVKLAIGERADTGLIRHGCDQAEVVARFEDPAGEERILRRVVRSEGASRAYIDGAPCPVGQLRKLGETLIEIHGQHEHYSLLQADRQQAVIDEFADNEVLREAVAGAFDAWREAREELATLREDAGLSQGERDLLAFQVEELEAALADAKRVEELHATHRKLAAVQELSEICAHGLGLLDERVTTDLAALQQDLRRAVAIDPELAEAGDLVESALIHCEETLRLLAAYQRDMEEGDVEDLDRRLGRLHDLARKHRMEVGGIPDKHGELQERLARAENAEAREAELERRLDDLAAQYEQADSQLTGSRAQAAEAFSRDVTSLMQELGMRAGRFEAVISDDPEGSFAKAGRARVEFRVTTNPGQPAGNLARIASGGELSRIGLAIKVSEAAGNENSTLIFDEVDAGVGGAIAELVGERLRGLAADRQVFCVTHLPQVASRGHQHLRVTKSAQGTPEVTPLSGSDRIQEIARMLGGKTITERTRAHAEEMLEAD
ncbi:MAG: DNA repair protein RecN [Xanthomonadales bacterium]|nr:DNA repair protein RecN [Xanthomonadales bacterium]